MRVPEIRFQVIVIDLESYLDLGRLRGIDSARRMRERVRDVAPVADVLVHKWMRVDQTDHTGRHVATFLVTGRTERGWRGFIDAADRQGWVEETSMSGWQRVSFKPTYMLAEHSAWR